MPSCFGVIWHTVSSQLFDELPLRYGLPVKVMQGQHLQTIGQCFATCCLGHTWANSTLIGPSAVPAVVADSGQHSRLTLADLAIHLLQAW